MVRFLGAAAIAAAVSGVGASAQSCGGEYVVKRGDSLSVIADRLYKDAKKWTVIHTTNIGAIGDDPDSILAGQKLHLGCIAGLPTGLRPSKVVASTQTRADEQVVTRTSTDLLGTPELPRIKLVTGDHFQPFTHRGLMNDGLLAEVVDSAMTASVGEAGYDTFWINDWASHTNSMMPGHLMEMAFPWAKPDCDGNPNEQRCIDYHFSEPMFEYLVLLFVNKAAPIPFSSDRDIEGRTLCRPDGYTLHMLDQDGRNWLRDGKIKLEQPVAVGDCFEMLVNGQVDGVVLNEFTARDTIKNMGLEDQISAVQSRPVSITGLHVMVHKTHPQAEALLAVIDDGLQAIKDNGRYQEIVARHMEAIWANYN